MKKTRIFLLLSALLMLWLLATDWAAPPPNADFFVRDEAGVFSRSARMEMATNITVMVVFIGWVKRRLYPPQYPLEKKGPFQPAHAPDLLTHRPR